MKALISDDTRSVLTTAGVLLLVAICAAAFDLPAILVHEGSHAIACHALGGNIGGFRHWLYTADPLSNHTGTDCSIKPYPPILWIAGPLGTNFCWLSSLFFVWLITRHSPKRGAWKSIIWAGWGLLNLYTIWLEMIGSYGPASVWHDTPQFVHLTGINPNLIAIPLAIILFVSGWLWWQVEYRFLPESILSDWNQLRAGIVSAFQRG